MRKIEEQREGRREEELIYTLLNAADGSFEEREEQLKTEDSGLSEKERARIRSRIAKSESEAGQRRETEERRGGRAGRRALALIAALLLLTLGIREDLRLRIHAAAKGSLDRMRQMVREAFPPPKELAPYIAEGGSESVFAGDVEMKLDWVLLDGEELYCSLLTDRGLSEEEKDPEKICIASPMIREIRIGRKTLTKYDISNFTEKMQEGGEGISRSLLRCQLEEEPRGEVELEIFIDRILFQEEWADPAKEEVLEPRVLPAEAVFRLRTDTGALAGKSILRKTDIERSGDGIRLHISALRLSPVSGRIYAEIEEPAEPEKVLFYKLEGRTDDGRFVEFALEKRKTAEKRGKSLIEGVFRLEEGESRLENITQEQLYQEVRSMKLQACYSSGYLLPEGEEEPPASFRIEGGRHFWKSIGEPFEIEIKK